MKHLHSRLVINGDKITKIILGKKRYFVIAHCKCGVEKVVNYNDFIAGKIKSCGCLKMEKSVQRIKDFNKSATPKERPGYIHGDDGTRFCTIFKALKGRCNNKNNPKYKNYGNRGIICEWSSYLNFKKEMYASYLKHVAKFGEKNTSIDRVNNDGNYCRQNCRWATAKQQANNRRKRI